MSNKKPRKGPDLWVRYTRKERNASMPGGGDLLVDWTPHPSGFGTTKSTGSWVLLTLLSPERMQELDARGFDISTLRFSIRRKAGAQT